MERHSHTIPLLILLLLFFSLTSAAPDVGAQEVATGNQVLHHLLTANVDARMMVRVIEINSYDYDTSEVALSVLREAGASEEVIAAVIQAESKGSEVSSGGAVAPNTQPPIAQATRHRGAGATLISDGMSHQMRPAKYVGMKSGINPYASKLKRRIAGSRSRLRITDSTPEFSVTFHSKGYPEDNIALVSAESKRDTRLITVGSRAMGRIRSSVPEKARIPLSFEESQEPAPSYLQAVHVRPTKPLPAGEYVLIVEFQFLDFAVEE